jgi:hypothetical protein
MKRIIILLLMAVACESFVMMPRCREGLTKSMIHQTAATSSDNVDDLIRAAQQEWKQQAAISHAIEQSLEMDPDLDGLVDHCKGANRVYRNKEEHKHDSFGSELEHSLGTDPDLANVVVDIMKKEHPRKVDNPAFMEREMHVHDSFLNEIEHSIDTDPDLSSYLA